MSKITPKNLTAIILTDNIFLSLHSFILLKEIYGIYSHDSDEYRGLSLTEHVNFSDLGGEYG
jgi:hypothetical protein